MGWTCLRERDRLLLEDLRDHTQEALAFLGSSSLESYLQDRALQLITERLLEVLGEAGGSLSEEAREQVPFDWRAVRGLRNILAHQYGDIDHRLLYGIVKNRLPALLDAVHSAPR